jgi:hypothetical protein
MISKIELRFDNERSDSEAQGGFVVSSDVDSSALKHFIASCAIKRFYLKFNVDDFFVTIEWGNGHDFNGQRFWDGRFHLFNQSLGG